MNSIDDFFRNNLKEHEVKPSERANLLFANRIEVKKKKKPLAIWYFGLAASLVLVTLIGLYFNKVQKSSDYTLAKVESSLELEKPSSESNFKKDVEDKNSGADSRIVSLDKKSNDNLSLIPKSSFLENNEPISLEVIDDSSLALVTNIEMDNTDKNINKLMQGQNEKVQTLIYLTPILALNQVNPFGGGPKIVTNPTPTNKFMVEEYFADDKSLLARVLDEVKSLKKGEKVDFNKLGFKPFDELSLDKEGFIVSETNQIKEKISWVRTRLNNNN